MQLLNNFFEITKANLIVREIPTIE